MPRDSFYWSKPWKDLRLKVLRRDRYICVDCTQKCLGKKKNGFTPHVDHIEPRLKRPDLALDITNLQTLCSKCHSKKTNWIDSPTHNRPAIGLDGYPLEPQ